MSGLGGGYQAGGHARVAAERGGGGPQMPPKRNDKAVALVGLAVVALGVVALLVL